MYRNLKREKAFTLLELLVVLAIIGILVGLSIGGIRIVQQINRDTQRKTLARDVTLALEAYNERQNTYPTATAQLKLTPGTATSNCTGTLIEIGTGTTLETVCSKVKFVTETNEQTAYANCIVSKMNAKTDSGKFQYCLASDGKSYRFLVKLERSSQPYDAGNAGI